VVVVAVPQSFGNLGIVGIGTWAKPQATKPWQLATKPWQLATKPWQLMKESIGEGMQLMQMQKMPFCCLAFVFGCICPFFPKRIHLGRRRIPPFVS
jgi:hypothetical protein